MNGSNILFILFSYQNFSIFHLKTYILSESNIFMAAVETGRRFFPNCSEILDQFLEYDAIGMVLLEKGTAEEQQMKQLRYTELKQDLKKALSKDLAEHKWMGSSSSSSCLTSQKVSGIHKVRRR